MLSSRFPQIVQLPKVKICSSVTICLAIHISDEKLWLRQEKTGDGNDHEENYFFRVTEAIFVGWFTLEYLIRFIVSPYKVWIQREGIVDLFSIALVGHNIWWENRWNGSFGPKNDPTLFFFCKLKFKTISLGRWSTICLWVQRSPILLSRRASLSFDTLWIDLWQRI